MAQMNRFWRIGLIVWLLAAFSPSAAAHPLDEFYQATYITMAPNRINLTVELYIGVLLGPRLLAQIDSNQDDHISEAEGQAYLNRFLKDITFEIDGRSAALTATEREFPPPLDIRAGTGLIRFKLYADLPPDHRGRHQFFYQNNYEPDLSVYIINFLAGDPRWMQVTNQDRDIFQSSLRVDYTIDPAAPLDYGTAEAPAGPEVPANLSAGQQRLTGYLYRTEWSPLLLLVALALSTVLGGLHALTPGHGKTLVAAYLIGSRGTVRHAVALGGIVTLTHTASVIVIGLLALVASQFIVPKVFVPALEILSGLLVIYLGSRLLRARWQAYKDRPANHAHHHPHSHPHEHPHPNEPDHPHPHLPEQVEMSDLLTLGISGGLIPCPEALGIMLIAIGLNRILLGLGLVVAFSFGLAAILIVIGILLVRSKSLLDRVGRLSQRWQTLLPLASAVIVTLLGLGIILKGLLPYIRY